MYPHPELNSYLQEYNGYMPKKILNRMVDRAMYERAACGCGDYQPHVIRLTDMQPQCYAPRVDVTRAKCAYGSFALPKLRRELHSDDPMIVRQAVTTLGDLVVDPEKLFEAVELNIPDRLTDLLTSNDPYLRERVAMIYVTIANQAAGREAILKNLTTISNLSKGLDDRLAAVRLKFALVVEMLARDYYAADQLCACGFVKTITDKLDNEKRDILVVYLDALKSLLHRHVKAKAIEDGLFDKLVVLLKRKDEIVLCSALACLRILCEDIAGKEKAIDIDLLRTLKEFLKDERVSVNLEAGRVVSFVTITTAGKLRALELKMTFLLLHLAANKCRCCCQLLLTIIKILTNLAEAPSCRKCLCEQYFSKIEDLDTGDSEVLRKHKQTLLDVICWKP